MEGDLLDELINAAENLVGNSEPQNVRAKEIDIFSDGKSEVRTDPDDGAKNDDKSVIHTGLSDSSDDEDNKYFEETKYNDYGKGIKRLVQPPTSEGSSSSFKSTGERWKPKPNVINANPLSLPVSKRTSPDVLADPLFGIRVVNPLVSTKVLEERMVGRENVSMMKLKWYIQRLSPDKDWVISGVIVQKSASKTSQKGNQFCIWSVSDLRPGLKTASVFLFGKAYQQLWKTVVGTVVGILNPNVLDKKDGSKDEACLSIDNHQKVMIIGQSKDFGICKSTKKSGEQCTAFVNTNDSEHCIYHLKQEYQKYSKRADVQSTFQGRGLTALRNKVLGKNEVFYAGKLYTAIPATKSKKLTAKDQGRLRSLEAKEKINLNGNDLIKSRNLSNQKKVATSVEIEKNQRIKDLALLRKLGGDSDLDKKVEFAGNLSREVSLEESKQAAVNVIDKLKRNKVENGGNPSKFDDGKSLMTVENRGPSSLGLPNQSEERAIDELKDPSRRIEGQINGHKSSSIEIKTNTGTPKESTVKTNQSSNNRPFLNSTFPTLRNGGKSTIDLSSPVSRKLKTRAKQNAINYVQKNGEIKKSNPMATKGTGMKRTIRDPDLTEENDPKRQKIQQNEFMSERFKKMMAATSAHADLLETRDDEEREKYFKKLEIKEKMEEKMASTYKIECKAVRCSTCKYTSFSAADRCKEEKHRLKVFDTFKRFFKCGDCGNRTVCLEVVPTVGCKNCGSGKWERTSMMKEKVEKNMLTLSIRGGEQTFLNSNVANANLDLLVPTD